MVIIYSRGGAAYGPFKYRIAEYIEGHNFDQFKKDYRTVDAVIRNFEIIGEGLRN